MKSETTGGADLNSSVCLVLGDNIFCGQRGMQCIVSAADANQSIGKLTGYDTPNE